MFCFLKTTKSLEMLEGCRVPDGGAIGQKTLQVAFRDHVEVGLAASGTPIPFRESRLLARALQLYLNRGYV